ncbi:hypothetical protein [Methylobacterium sp. WSM2598]|uniref:hypothetical protein n=1 Tax=Methylobacterium sp. WSM2598 TaxID=398261 RepID=UPI00039A1722|nr:hypothetical protein [Methylobacterium sp. WSM2598]
MAGRIRDFDWSATPLGPIADWSERLKLAVELMLASPLVSTLACGPHRLLLYNAAAARQFGDHHPAALGRPLPDTFSLGWATVAPYYARAFDGETVMIEVLQDGAGKWVDFRFLNVNRAFVKQTSMPYPVGKTATELLGSPNPRWTELYGQALDTGEPIRIEETEHTLGRTFDLNIFTLDGAQNQVAVLFTDITARKRAEAALREGEERQAFLLKLSDALRPIGDAQTLRATACRMLGEGLSASRVYYVGYEPQAGYGQVADDYLVDGLPSLAGQYPFEAFRATYGRIADGATWIVPNVWEATDLPEHEREYYAAQDVSAWVSVPLARDGTLAPCQASIDG